MTFDLARSAVADIRMGPNTHGVRQGAYLAIVMDQVNTGDVDGAKATIHSIGDAVDRPVQEMLHALVAGGQAIAGDFDGAIRYIIGQEYGALAAHVDCFSPMVYHTLCGRDVPWIAEITASIGKETGKPVWPIVQAMDDPATLSPQELRQAVQTALTATGSEGVIIFNLNALNPEKLKAVREVFNQRGNK